MLFRWLPLPKPRPGPGRLPILGHDLPTMAGFVFLLRLVPRRHVSVWFLYTLLHAMPYYKSFYHYLPICYFQNFSTVRHNFHLL